MKCSPLIFAAALFGFTGSAFAQGFVNLDFESANLTAVPSGQFGGEVPITNGIPGWSGFLGGTQVTQVLQNNLTLGDASIDILGPDWNAGGIIEGQYTVVLQPGANPLGTGNVGASISQTGIVPVGSESLEFKFFTSDPALANDFSVSLGGENLSLVNLGTGPNYTLYGADVSSFAGQSETLTVATPAQPNIAPYYFDSFDFSSFSIPEPSEFALFALGALSLGFWRWRKSAR